MTTPQQRDEMRVRNAAMRERVDTMMADLQRRTASLASAQAEAAAATGTATSPDGLVTVTVNAAGVVTAAEVDPARLPRSTAAQVGAAFVGATQAAAVAARALADEALAPLLADVPDLSEVFPGAPDLADVLPRFPEPPLTPPGPRASGGADPEDDADGSVLRRDAW